MRPPRERVWVVRLGDGATVAEIVSRLVPTPAEARAVLAEGRVFIGRQRVTSGGQRVRVGERVRVGAGGRAEASPEIEILFEGDGLLACVKPAGLPTVPDTHGASHALTSLVQAQRKTKLGVTSRLDRDVSGVVIFTTTPEAEERLRRAREEGTYHRRYVAIATTTLEVGESGWWTSPIGRANNPKLRAIHGMEAKEATTHYACVAKAGSFGLLAIDPVTGRTHQIRLHASHAGMPLLGDADYGGARRVVLGTGAVREISRIALHAARVIVPTPRGNEAMTLKAPAPQELIDLWLALGGDSEAWNRAT